MKLLVVDDHQVVLEGITALLQRLAPSPTILQAAGIDTALAIADAHPDLDAVLLDLRIPDQEGRNALRLLGERHPTLPVLIFSSSEDPGDVRQAFALGALGYVAKSAAPATILTALNLVMAGETYVPAFMVRASEHSEPATGALTERQAEVLGLLRERLSNREIARRLQLSEKTVKVHVTAILRSLGAKSRTDIVE